MGAGGGLAQLSRRDSQTPGRDWQQRAESGAQSVLQRTGYVYVLRAYTERKPDGVQLDTRLHTSLPLLQDNPHT